ncbi:MAG TPA: Hsp20/alpha crystallin family protein [Candidatus Krumholzibacteria bacterium]|nr:Hsp20/alpha crystallin family protein [Candidatus Krumholzibacteria bacterium]HRX51757.1 Hsp20/alpha crystallin family protein [Candidatus Krumholzibacteria bacterium]
MTTKMIPLGELLDTVFTPALPAPMRRAASLTPRTDILESDREFLLRLDLPGVAREDVAIELDGETLTIKAELHAEGADGYTFLRRERGGDLRFERSFELGRRIDRDGIGAALNDGVLTVSLPKNEQAVARKIEIK